MVYPILSKHYNAPNDSHKSAKDSPKPAKIPLEAYRSMHQDIPVSFGIDKHLPSSMSVRGDRVITKSGGGRTEVYDISDIGRYGLATTWDESGPRLAGWLSTARDNHSSRPSNSEISSVPEPRIAYIVGIKPLGMNLHRNDTQTNYTTPTIAHIGPKNFTGREVSAVHNRMQDTRNFLFDDKGIREETFAWLPFLAGEGLPIKREKPVYAIGVVHDVEGIGFKAAYDPNPAKRYMIFEDSFVPYVRESAIRLGLKTRKEIEEGAEALKRSIISHEALRHGAVETGGEPRDEQLQGLREFRFYSKLADLHKGTEMERIYRALAEEGRLYAADFSLWNRIKDEMSKEIAQPKKSGKRLLAETFRKHGIALGKKGAELEQYVNDRMAREYDALEGEPSFRTSSDGEDEGGLEGVVNGNREFSVNLQNERSSETLDSIAIGGDGASMPVRLISQRNRKGDYEGSEPETYESVGCARSMSDARRSLEKRADSRNPEAKDDPQQSAEANPPSE